VKVVLDASVAYRALDEDLLDPTMLEASEILAPDLLVSELLNARWQSVRTGAEAPTVDQIHSILELVTLLPTFPYSAEAAALSEELDHPVYDAMYLALARRERALLLTADERLRKKLVEHHLDHLLA
jgi:predicted nucleic acid-binding protein